MEQLTTFDRLTEKSTTEVQVKKNVQVEYIFDGRVIPYSGHKVWEINTLTGLIKEAEFKKEQAIDWFKAVAEYKNPTTTKREVIKNKNCVYISALNKETALTRYRTGKGSAILSENFNDISPV